MKRIGVVVIVLPASLFLCAGVATEAFATEKRGEIVNKNGGAPTKNKFQGTSSDVAELQLASQAK